jgi:hypothetical protein
MNFLGPGDSFLLSATVQPRARAACGPAYSRAREGTVRPANDDAVNGPGAGNTEAAALGALLPVGLGDGTGSGDSTR